MPSYVENMGYGNSAGGQNTTPPGYMRVTPENEEAVAKKYGSHYFTYVPDEPKAPNYSSLPETNDFNDPVDRSTTSDPWSSDVSGIGQSGMQQALADLRNAVWPKDMADNWNNIYRSRNASEAFGNFQYFLFGVENPDYGEIIEQACYAYGPNFEMLDGVLLLGPESVRYLSALSAKVKAIGKEARLTPSQMKSIKSYQDLINEHEQKLIEFIKDPYAHDNKGFLKNAPTPEIAQKIINKRVQGLQKEIETFKENIQKIIRGEL
jgi:hypothetical protein